MKTSYLALLPLASLLLAGCFSPVQDAAEDLETTTKTTLKVTTRAATGDIPYPVLVLAYDADGNLKGQQTLKETGDNISLKLAEGVYHISAVAGQSAYTSPASYDVSSSQISIPTKGYADAPLMLGGADVVLTSASAQVSVVLTYRVASLNLSLKEVPSDVTAVSVGISQQYGAITMTGAQVGKSTANVPCTLKSGVWTSDKVYLMPGAGTTTTLTLSLTNAAGQTSYSYELGEALAAAVPYNIVGTYVESTEPYITGVITIEGWQEERSIDFDFGSGSASGGTSTTVPSVDVSSLPAPGSVWNGHIVALVENASEDEEDVLLLAKEEQINVYSPIAPNHENDMESLAAAYNEGTLTGWSVPTEAEARQLKSAYAGNYDDLNGLIENLGGMLISTYSTANNARFLCEGGTKTFNFAATGSINNAGATVKYRLRLVKRVHVKL